MLAWTNKINLPAPLKFTENERNSPSHSLFQNNWTKSIYDDKVLLLSLKKLAVSPIYGVCAKLRQPSAGCSLKGPLCRIYIWPSTPSLELRRTEAFNSARHWSQSYNVSMSGDSHLLEKLSEAYTVKKQLGFFFLASQQPLRDSFHYETLSHLVQ